MQFYIKSDDGNFAEATQEQVDGTFKERFERFKRSEASNIRTEVEETVRKELTPTLKQELEQQIKADFQPKLDEAETKAKQLDIQLRQKTIAAEFGFKPETEKYLGDGTEEDMRKEAETLKSSFSSTIQGPDKTTHSGKSEVQTRTGIQVVI